MSGADWLLFAAAFFAGYYAAAHFGHTGKAA